jgi:hypothetical protein
MVKLYKYSSTFLFSFFFSLTTTAELLKLGIRNILIKHTANCARTFCHMIEIQKSPDA